MFGLVKKSTGLPWMWRTISVYSQTWSSLRFVLFIILIILSRNQYHCASHRCIKAAARVYSHFVMCIQKRDTCWFSYSVSKRTWIFIVAEYNTVLSHQGRKRIKIGVLGGQYVNTVDLCKDIPFFFLLGKDLHLC